MGVSEVSWGERMGWKVSRLLHWAVPGKYVHTQRNLKMSEAQKSWTDHPRSRCARESTRIQAQYQKESSLSLSPPEAKPIFSPRGVGATMTSPLDLPVHPNLALPTSLSPWSDCLQCVSKPHTAPLKTFHTARLVLLHSEKNPICSSFLQALEPSSHLHSCSIWLFQLSHAEHFALH